MRIATADQSTGRIDRGPRDVFNITTTTDDVTDTVRYESRNESPAAGTYGVEYALRNTDGRLLEQGVRSLGASAVDQVAAYYEYDDEGGLTTVTELGKGANLQDRITTFERRSSSDIRVITYFMRGEDPSADLVGWQQDRSYDTQGRIEEIVERRAVPSSAMGTYVTTFGYAS